MAMLSSLVSVSSSRLYGGIIDLPDDGVYENNTEEDTENRKTDNYNTIYDRIDDKEEFVERIKGFGDGGGCGR